MKKVSTAVAALALGMSEVTIREMYKDEKGQPAKEIEFSEVYKLMENPKHKRFDADAAKLKDQLIRFGKIMEE